MTYSNRFIILFINKSFRLKGYDYSTTGAYFITICIKDYGCLFGKVVDGIMKLNRMGKISNRIWSEIPGHFVNVELGSYVVMPNHVHGVVFIMDDVVLKVEHKSNENSNYVQ